MDIIFELVMLVIDFFWFRKMWKQKKAADEKARLNMPDCAPRPRGG